jgi:hypothetical protein
MVDANVKRQTERGQSAHTFDEAWLETEIDVVFGLNDPSNSSQNFVVCEACQVNIDCTPIFEGCPRNHAFDARLMLGLFSNPFGFVSKCTDLRLTLHKNHCFNCY